MLEPLTTLDQVLGYLRNDPGRNPRECHRLTRPEVALLLAEIDRLREDATNNEASFDLRHRADMRGIKAWRDAHPGNDLVQPDHGDLVCWLIAEIDRLRSLVPADAPPADFSDLSYQPH